MDRMLANGGFAKLGKGLVDAQKRRPERPPKLNGGALHLGRTDAHTSAPDQRYRNRPAATECGAHDAIAHQ